MRRILTFGNIIVRGFLGGALGVLLSPFYTVLAGGIAVEIRSVTDVAMYGDIASLLFLIGIGMAIWKGVIKLSIPILTLVFVVMAVIFPNILMTARHPIHVNAKAFWQIALGLGILIGGDVGLTQYGKECKYFQSLNKTFPTFKKGNVMYWGGKWLLAVIGLSLFLHAIFDLFSN